MATVGSASLLIVPSAKGFKRNLNREVGGPLGAVGGSAGKEAGKGFQGGFFPLMRGAIGPLAGVAAGLGFGKAFASGLGTANFMEQARISFETLLGSGGAAEKMLGNITKFAAKTPFELPGLTNSVRQLLGAGASADEVIPIMRDLGDATGALGINQEGLTGIVRAWTQIMGKGKVSAEEMLQITEAGLPIWPLLSRAMGKPVAELQKLASEGKLMADDVLPVLQAQMGKEYGGSMAKQAGTLAGVWSTVKDNINIAMSEALEPLIPLLVDLLPRAAGVLVGAIKGMGTGIAAGVAFIQPKIEAVKELIAGLQSGEGGGGGPLSGLIEAARPLAETFQSKILPAVEGFISAVRDGMGPVIETIGGIIRTSLLPFLEETARKLGPLFSKAGETIALMAETIGPILQGIADLIRNVWGFIGPFVMDILGSMVDNVIGIFDGLFTVIQGIFQLLKGLFTGDWALMWEGLKNIVGGAVKAVWNFLQLWLIGRAVKVVKSAGSAIKGLFTNLWTAVKSRTASFVKGIVSNVRGFIDGIRLRIMYGVDKIRSLWSNAWGAVASFFRGIVSRIVGAVRGFVSSIRSRISSTLAGIRNLWNGGWNAMRALVSTAFGRIVSAVRGGVSNVIGFIRGLPGKIKGILSGLGNLLKSAGKAILDGLLKGLKDAWRGVTDFVGGIAGWIADNKGPIAYDRRLLIPAGKAIMDGLGKGLEGELGSLKSTLDTVTDSIVDGVEEGARGVARASEGLVPRIPRSPRLRVDQSVAGAVTSARGATAAGGTSVTINGVSGNADEFADALTFALRRSRRGGVYTLGGTR